MAHLHPQSLAGWTLSAQVELTRCHSQTPGARCSRALALAPPRLRGVSRHSRHSRTPGATHWRSPRPAQSRWRSRHLAPTRSQTRIPHSREASQSPASPASRWRLRTPPASGLARSPLPELILPDPRASASRRRGRPPRPPRRWRPHGSAPQPLPGTWPARSAPRYRRPPLRRRRCSPSPPRSPRRSRPGFLQSVYLRALGALWTPPLRSPIWTSQSPQFLGSSCRARTYSPSPALSALPASHAALALASQALGLPSRPRSAQLLRSLRLRSASSARHADSLLGAPCELPALRCGAALASKPPLCSQAPLWNRFHWSFSALAVSPPSAFDCAGTAQVEKS
mmetsp:Transcript_49976/g.119268  ORF Transcript_49976/g.119268 Transcript_49976/m.119268 type:complete len:340 (+) Transcript_49976:944-1963(+)